MVQHHQAAVRMASDYNSDPIANNLLLRRMNNDIMVDQRYEIDFIESVLARYPGDAANVPDDPRMVAIMQRSLADMMMHMPADRMKAPAHEPAAAVGHWRTSRAQRERECLEIGRATCRERVCQSEEIARVDG